MSNQMNELRLAVADILGMDQSWPDHGNAPLAIAAAVVELARSRGYGELFAVSYSDELFLSCGFERAPLATCADYTNAPTTRRNTRAIHLQLARVLQRSATTPGTRLAMVRLLPPEPAVSCGTTRAARRCRCQKNLNSG